MKGSGFRSDGLLSKLSRLNRVKCAGLFVCDRWCLFHFNAQGMKSDEATKLVSGDFYVSNVIEMFSVGEKMELLNEPCIKKLNIGISN